MVGRTVVTVGEGDVISNARWIAEEQCRRRAGPSVLAGASLSLRSHRAIARGRHRLARPRQSRGTRLGGALVIGSALARVEACCKDGDVYVVLVVG